MAQKGFVFRKGNSWFLKYRQNKTVDGQILRKQKCVKLADYCDRYRCESDLDELVAEKMAGVHQAARCPHSSDSFESYVEDVYLPFVLRTMKPSTYSGFKAYWERYIKPVAGSMRSEISPSPLLQACSKISHKLNTDTLTKVRSVLSGIFTYAMSEGHFPARSQADKPASWARIPQESASEPKPTVAAKRENVQPILTALKGMSLERAAVAIIAYTGVRPVKRVVLGGRSGTGQSSTLPCGAAYGIESAAPPKRNRVSDLLP